MNKSYYLKRLVPQHLEAVIASLFSFIHAVCLEGVVARNS